MKLILCTLLFVLAFCPGAPAPAQSAEGSPAEARFQIPATDDGLPGSGPIRRYDWFRKLWAERRSAWARHAAQDQNAVVFLGDSITQGWGDEMFGSFSGMKV